MLTYQFVSDLDEVVGPLESFTCLADFFSRRIWLAAERPIAIHADVVII